MIIILNINNYGIKIKLSHYLNYSIICKFLTVSRFLLSIAHHLSFSIPQIPFTSVNETLVPNVQLLYPFSLYISSSV